MTGDQLLKLDNNINGKKGEFLWRLKLMLRQFNQNDSHWVKSRTMACDLILYEMSPNVFLKHSFFHWVEGQ